MAIWRTTLSSEDAFLNRALALFQEYYQLPGNGELNNATLEQMRKPQCGVEDFSNNALSTQERGREGVSRGIFALPTRKF